MRSTEQCAHALSVNDIYENLFRDEFQHVHKAQVEKITPPRCHGGLANADGVVWSIVNCKTAAEVLQSPECDGNEDACRMDGRVGQRLTGDFPESERRKACLFTD